MNEGGTNSKQVLCKRPYSLGKRLESSNGKRAKILAAARARLETEGLLGLTFDALARDSGVTRQTIHNLFGTKADVLEALFDQIALHGGMERMAVVMRQTNAESMLTGFVEIFNRFWSRDRLLIRRIHGLAAIDPDFGAAVEARNRRRRVAAVRVVDLLEKNSGSIFPGDPKLRSAMLYALTSFEFFDALAKGCGSTDSAASEVLDLVRNTFLVQIDNL